MEVGGSGAAGEGGGEVAGRSEAHGGRRRGCWVRRRCRAAWRRRPAAARAAAVAPRAPHAHLCRSATCWRSSGTCRSMGQCLHCEQVARIRHAPPAPAEYWPAQLQCSQAGRQAGKGCLPAGRREARRPEGGLACRPCSLAMAPKASETATTRPPCSCRICAAQLPTLPKPCGGAGEQGGERQQRKGRVGGRCGQGACAGAAPSETPPPPQPARSPPGHAPAPAAAAALLRSPLCASEAHPASKGPPG